MSVIKVRWGVDELANVMTQYTHEKVYRSIVPSPFTWVEITGVGTRPLLVAGTDVYTFDDATGAVTYYYCVAHYNTGTGAESSKSAEILGSARLNDFLTLRDLYASIGSQRVRQLFDDDNDGTLDDSMDVVDQFLAAAESECYARLMRAFGTKDAVKAVALADPAIRQHCAWIALELASERRPEFAQPDGRGAFAYQYERAIGYFESIAKGKNKVKPGTTSAQEGGNLNPPRVVDEGRFTFAPDKYSTDGHGGY
jgi:hypothetical protein